MHIESQITYLTSFVYNNLKGDRCDVKPDSYRLFSGVADDLGLPTPEEHLFNALQCKISIIALNKK